MPDLRRALQAGLEGTLAGSPQPTGSPSFAWACFQGPVPASRDWSDKLIYPGAIWAGLVMIFTFITPEGTE